MSRFKKTNKIPRGGRIKNKKRKVKVEGKKRGQKIKVKPRFTSEEAENKPGRLVLALFVQYSCSCSVVGKRFAPTTRQGQG
jgi:hypothetical protein